MESLVVPDMGETSTLSSPSNWLTRVDLPALGRPMIEIFNISVKGYDSFISSESSSSFRIVFNSEKPMLCAEETFKDSENPNLSNSFFDSP